MMITRETVAKLADAAVMIDGIKEQFGVDELKLLHVVHILHSVAKFADDENNFGIYLKDEDCADGGIIE